MHLDDFINSISCGGHHKKYNLSDTVSEYIYYVDSEPFFVSPTITTVETDCTNSNGTAKILLFSAPGATGKSTLAKYLSYTTGAVYWDLSKDKIGDHYFIGALSDAVESDNYSQFLADLRASNVRLVIDAFDEAELVSGRRMIANFLTDMSKALADNESNSIICLARTSTAQFIASFCLENCISIKHFEIDYFSRETAKQFVQKKISALGRKLDKVVNDCIDLYFDKISEVVGSDSDLDFIGYAPVLETIAEHIDEKNNTIKFFNDLSQIRKTQT